MTENSKNLDEERFARWIDRLRYVLDISNSESASNDRDNLIETILSAVNLETSGIPKWILSSRNQDDILKQLISSDDLKYVLRHFITPHACQGYSQFFEDMKKSKDAMDTEDNSCRMNVFQVPTKDNVLAYFQQLSTGQQDELIGLCKLADVHHRIHRANQRDKTFLDRLMSIENKRDSKYKKQIDQRKKIMDDLRDTGPSVYHNYSTTAQEMLKHKSDALRAAEEEEEKVRLMYETAREKTKAAQLSFLKIEENIVTVKEQRKMLLNIHSSRLEVEKYNESKSSLRSNIYETLSQSVNMMNENIIYKKFYPEINQMFGSLFGVFKDANMVQINPEGSIQVASAESTVKEEVIDRTKIASFYATRIGLEMVRLWRQMMQDSIDESLKQSLNSLADQLKAVNKSNKALDPRKFPDILSGSNFKGDNTTVVLFFDHLLHNTPPNHMESEARVLSSLRLVNAQLKTGNPAENIRSLQLVKCNDIPSAPFWCFPLVHSPQYLSHLWSLSEEAKDFDLLVPLEFETEWESFDDSDADDEVETEKKKITRKRIALENSKVRETLPKFPDDITSKLDEENVNKLKHLLEPAPEDDILAAAIYPANTGTDSNTHEVKTPKKRGRPSNNSDKQGIDVVIGTGKRGPGRPKLSRNTSVSAEDVQIRTPYGPGMLLVDQIKATALETKIFPVNLIWGAMGYFHASVIKVFQPKSYGGIPRETFRKIIFGDYSDVKPFPSMADGRFAYTDPMIHKLYARLGDAAGLQKFIIEAAGLDRPKVSMWVHGRSTQGANNEIENGILLWIYSVEKDEIERRIAEGDSSRVLKAIMRAKINTKKHSHLAATDGFVDLLSSDLYQNVERKWNNNADKMSIDERDDDDSNDEGNNDQKKKKKENDDDDDADNDDKEEVKEKKRGRKRREAMPTVIPPDTKPEEVAFKNILKRVMEERKVTQGALAGQLINSYSYFSVDQNKISQWMRYQLRPHTNADLITVCLKWLRDRMSSLQEDEKEVISKMLEWHKKRDNGTATEADYNSLVDAISQYDSNITETYNPTNSVNHHALMPLRDMLFSDNDNDQSTGSKVKEDQESDVDMKEDDSLEQDASNREMGESMSLEEKEEKRSITNKKMLRFMNANDIVTVGDFHRNIYAEIRRRKIFMPEVFSEAKLGSISSVENEDLVHFISKQSFSKLEIAKEFCRSLLKWLMISKLQNDPSSESNATYKVKKDKIKERSPRDTKEGSCKYCGKPRREFPTDMGLTLHTAWCRKKYEAVHGEETPLNDDNPFFTANKIHEFSKGESSPSKLKSSQSTSSIPSHRLLGGKDDEEMAKDKQGDHDNAHIEEMKPLPIQFSDDNAVSDKAVVKTESETPKTSNTMDTDIKVERVATKREASSLTNEETDQIDESKSKKPKIEKSINDPTTEGASVSITSNANSNRDSNESIIKKLNEPSYSENTIIEADLFPLGSHYFACEICKGNDALLLCIGCPCSFHPKCVKTAFNHNVMKTEDYVCGRCEETDVLKAREIEAIEKNDTAFLLSKWIFIYSAMLHKWRMAQVLKSSPRNGVFLVQLLRHDKNKPGKCYWMDISKTKVLLSPKPPVIPPRTVPDSKSSIPSSSNVASLSHGNNSMRQIKPSSNVEKVKVEEKKRVKKLKMPYKDIFEALDRSSPVDDLNSDGDGIVNGMTDTYVSAQTLQAALCTTGIACRAVDIALTNKNTNVFACVRPPGHHAGRYGCTDKCVSTGFCLLNNAVIALVYARVRWGLKRVAIVDIDVHFGNGTAELLRKDPNAFFGSVHMLYNDKNVPDPITGEVSKKFFPEPLGATEYSENYVSIAVKPTLEPRKQIKKKKFTDFRQAGFLSPEGENASSAASAMMIEDQSDRILRGPQGYRRAIEEIIPSLVKFQPQLLIISAGFDGYYSDPIGGELDLNLEDYRWSTEKLIKAMEKVQGKGNARVISLLEGGYDTQGDSMGLAKCVNVHVEALRR